MESDPFFADIPVVHCPHCGERYLRPEDLEVHRERHRPVPKRVTGSANCPKGCKRWLLPDTPEAHAHLSLCDGSLPIDGLPKAMKKRWFCEEHSYGTNGPKTWGLHKKEHHGGKDPLEGVKRIRNIMPVPTSADGIEQAIAIMTAEKKRLLAEAERMDAGIKALSMMVKVNE